MRTAEGMIRKREDAAISSSFTDLNCQTCKLTVPLSAEASPSSAEASHSRAEASETPQASTEFVIPIPLRAGVARLPGQPTDGLGLPPFELCSRTFRSTLRATRSATSHRDRRPARLVSVQNRSRIRPKSAQNPSRIRVRSVVRSLRAAVSCKSAPDHTIAPADPPFADSRGCRLRRFRHSGLPEEPS